MEIDHWKEVPQEEIEKLPENSVISITSSLHITEVRRKEKDQIYRSLYEISTGDLLLHQKLVEQYREVE